MIDAPKSISFSFTANLAYFFINLRMVLYNFFKSLKIKHEYKRVRNSDKSFNSFL